MWVNVVIDDSTNKTVTGQWEFDRDSGGTLICPAGSSFPGTPVAKEWFWRTDEKKLYRRNDGDTAWDAIEAAVSAHDLGGSDHNADTLENLNSKVTDATLIDTADSRLSDDRDPTAHASEHENGGGDEISVAGLSGELADDQPPKTHALGTAHSTDTLANLNAKVTDATLIDTNDSRLSDDRDPTAHASEHENGGGDEISVAGLSGELADDQPPKTHALGTAHSTDTLANLNAKVTDATLIDTADSRLSDDRDPNAHASSHQNAGGDEISVAGLSGELADNQPPKTHALGTAHSTDTLANLNAKVSDATLDDSSDPRTDDDAIHDDVTGEINAITAKSSLVSNDVFLIEDSAAAYAKKKVTVANLPGGVDTTAIHKATAAEISAITQKNTPVDADLLLIEDSAASNVKKRIEIGDLPGGGGGGIFSEFQSAINESVGSTTSTSWQQRLRITITPATEGQYILILHAQTYCSSSSALNASWMQLELDDTTQLGVNAYTGTTLHASHTFLWTGTLSAATHTFDLDWCRQGTTTTAYIKGARMMLYRVDP